MKQSRLLLTLASMTMLASCNNSQGTGKSLAEKVVEEATKKAAIALWADTGSPIDQKLENSAVGAHAPFLAKHFSVRVDGELYQTSISWAGIDDVDWKKYKADADHIVVIPSRRSVGGETLKATFTPTFTYEDATLAGKEYKFTCEPYDVDPVNKTLAEMNEGFFVSKTIKTKDAIRTKGKITFMSPSLSSVIIQDGEYAVQLYNSSAYSAFYYLGASISTVGKIKNYYGAEFDPVLDVSPTEELGELPLFSPTSTNIEAFKTESAKGNLKQANRLVSTTLEVAKDSVEKKDKEGNPTGVWDTVYLKASEGDSEIALYTKTAYCGDEGLKEISNIFKDCKKGDKVQFKGALAYYSSANLTEVNIYSAADVQIVEKASDNTGPLAD